MNKKIMISLGVVILIFLGVGGYLSLTKKPTNISNSTSETTDQKMVPPTNSQSLKDLFTSGESKKCAISLTEGTQGSGVFYISGGKMRGDFTVKVSDRDSTTHMIGDGTTSYIWVDGQTTGFKMAFDPANAPKPSGSVATTQSFDLEKKMDYNCTNWSADSSMFNVPASITFNDMNSYKTQTGTTVKDKENTDMKVQQCAACDNAPESYKAQCKAALGCS